VVEREEQLQEAQAQVAMMSAEVTQWSAKLQTVSSPEAQAQIQALLEQAEQGKATADAEEAEATRKLTASKAQLESGNYTELGHVDIENVDSLNQEHNATDGGNRCIELVEEREAAQHAVLLEEWTFQEQVAEENMKIKDTNAMIAIGSRESEVTLRATYVAARNVSDHARAVATAAFDEYEAVATGGKCCAFLEKSRDGANPKVMKEECCDAHGCTYDESKTLVYHAECSWHGELTPSGCKCHEMEGQWIQFGNDRSRCGDYTAEKQTAATAAECKAAAEEQGHAFYSWKDQDSNNCLTAASCEGGLLQTSKDGWTAYEKKPDVWGGTTCSIKTSSAEKCFSGLRSNGDRPSDAAACRTCYSCTDSASVKSDGSARFQSAMSGQVMEAGSDVCDRLEGKENLCLSCPAGSGLLRLGDSNLEYAALGYSEAGRCQPYPVLAVDKATPGHSSPQSCKSVCYPEQASTFKEKRVLSCTKVCSAWNPVKVEKAGVAVSATALCHLQKDSHCIANATASTTAATLHTEGHTCVNKKSVTPATICYSKSSAGGTHYDDGYGTVCDGDSVPMTDAAVRDWLTNHAAGSRWCCYKQRSLLPDWMQAVPTHMWCAESAMRE